MEPETFVLSSFGGSRNFFLYLACACDRQNSPTAWVSFSVVNGACKRCTRAEPEGRYSMSPLPRSDSAPLQSRMVRESIFVATRKEMRDGKLALIKPVITSTDGRCVASTR